MRGLQQTEVPQVSTGKGDELVAGDDVGVEERAGDDAPIDATDLGQGQAALGGLPALGEQRWSAGQGLHRRGLAPASRRRDAAEPVAQDSAVAKVLRRGVDQPQAPARLVVEQLGGLHEAAKVAGRDRVCPDFLDLL